MERYDSEGAADCSGRGGWWVVLGWGSSVRRLERVGMEWRGDFGRQRDEAVGRRHLPSTNKKREKLCPFYLIYILIGGFF